MRITLVIDNHILRAAKETAAVEKKSVGEVISSLARRALAPAKTKTKTRNGVPLLKIRKRARISSELVKQLHEGISFTHSTASIKGDRLYHPLNRET